MEAYKRIELQDKETFSRFLSLDPPQTSELTFTNLFMWRHRYRPCWRTWDDCLLIMLQPDDKPAFGLPPVGTGDKAKALAVLCEDLKNCSSEVRVERVGRDFVDRHVDPDTYEITADRDNSDYVYLAEHLITLSGNKFHKKKNHVNKFLKNYEFEYRSLDTTIAKLCLDLQETWCELRDCGEHPDLMAEDMAVYEALKHYEALDFQGGAILMGGRVEAFGLGEPLNPDTAVIHIEKANPDIQGLYAAVNQLFCRDAWSEMKFVNREQDLGVEGLRKAKLSYHPDHLVDKFIVIPR